MKPSLSSCEHKEHKVMNFFDNLLVQNPWTYVLLLPLLLNAVLSACYLCCSVDIGALGKEVFHHVEMTAR